MCASVTDECNVGRLEVNKKIKSVFCNCRTKIKCFGLYNLSRVGLSDTAVCAHAREGDGQMAFF